MFSLNQKKSPWKTSRHLLSASIMVALGSMSQLAAAETNKDTAENDDVEVILVTARLTQEKVQEVPFSVSVLGENDLKNRLMLSVEDALRNAPGVDVYSSGGATDANIRIRGVGSLTQVNKDDGSVVVNIDNVSMPAGNVSLGTLDMQRLEVLKGPQGTLFGRNSEAGAINITTNKPTQMLEGHVRAEMGEKGQRLFESVISGPFTDSLSGRFAIRYTGEDHWINNSTNNQPLTEPESLAFRGHLLWDINEDSSVLFTAERQKQEDFLNLQLLQPFGDQPASEHTPGAFDGNEKTIERYSVQFDHLWDEMQFTSISALINTDFDYLTGFDKTTAGAVFNFPVEYLRGDKQDQRTLSQDLRLTSLPEADIFWVVGINLQDTERSFDSRDLVSMARQDRDHDNDSQAIYGETTISISDDLKFTAGVRYTRESRGYTAEYRSFNQDGSLRLLEEQRELDDSYFTGRLALSYALSESTNVYGVISRGNKSGGFNDFATQFADSVPYRPASIDAYELGIKSVTKDLTLNGSVFFNKVDDDHLLGFDFNTFASAAVNADTETFGAEFEGRWAASEHLTLSGGLSYLDTEITKDVMNVSGGPVKAGNEVPDVPNISANFALTHTMPLGDFWGLSSPELVSNLSYRYVDERPADAQNHFNLDAYGKMDVRVALQSDNWELYLWADNLLDKEYELYGYINALFAPTARIGAPARDRRAGAGVIYRF